MIKEIASKFKHIAIQLRTVGDSVLVKTKNEINKIVNLWNDNILIIELKKYVAHSINYVS